MDFVLLNVCGTSPELTDKAVKVQVPDLSSGYLRKFIIVIYTSVSTGCIEMELLYMGGS